MAHEFLTASAVFRANKLLKQFSTGEPLANTQLKQGVNENLPPFPSFFQKFSRIYSDLVGFQPVCSPENPAWTHVGWSADLLIGMLNVTLEQAFEAHNERSSGLIEAKIFIYHAASLTPTLGHPLSNPP